MLSAIETVEQVGGDFGVTVRYRYKQGDVHVDFFAAEAIAADDDHSQLYWRKGSDSSTDPTPNLDEAERYFDGSVKWDGCSHFYFGDENGYLHLCGVDDVKKLSEAVRTVHNRCGQLMQQGGGHLLDGEFEFQEPDNGIGT